MFEIFKKLQRGLFSQSSYPQDRFIREKLTMEQKVRKTLSGVRYTGGVKEPNMFELMHEKESQFLLGIVPDKPPYPATSPPPDSSSDRPELPDDPDFEYDDYNDYGWEKENIEREVEYMRRSRLTSLGESQSVE